MSCGAGGPNILASQFHVEFDEPLVLQKIWTTLKDVGRLDDGQAVCSRRVLEAGGQMNAAMLQVRVFLVSAAFVTESVVRVVCECRHSVFGLQFCCR